MLDLGSLSVEDIWKNVCTYLKKELCAETYEQWFQPVIPIRIENDEICLGVSDDFFAGWMSEHYEDLIIDALQKATGRNISINFETGHNVPDYEKELNHPVNDEEADNERFNDSNRITLLNYLQRFSFNNFVVGEENRYAYTATYTASQHLGEYYNPLFIYGGTGLGKSHLLQAVATEVLKANPKAIVEYITCENFLNLYVDSLRSKKHADFRNRFRGSDVLLVDDVHQLANKTQLQEEFFNTFNTLYNRNKQIILTSDKQPCEIKGLEDRLVSRFESGVTTEIISPGFETRLAILKMKQEDHLIKMNDDILYFIASKITSNVRRLEGALLKLVAYSSAMSDCVITIDLAEQLLGKLLEEESAQIKVNIDIIQKRVAEEFDIRMSDILGNKRPKNIAVPRMIAMYLSRKMTDLSFPEIANAFGGKNHATIMHACKKIEFEIKNDDKIKHRISSIKSKLTN